MLEKAAAYDALALNGDALPIYKFDHKVMGGDDIVMSSHRIKVPGYSEAIDLDMKSPFADLI